MKRRMDIVYLIIVDRGIGKRCFLPTDGQIVSIKVRDMPGLHIGVLFLQERHIITVSKSIRPEFVNIIALLFTPPRISYCRLVP